MRLNYIDNVDCLEGMKQIPDGSVDLVLTDPPYGTMRGFSERFDWDIPVPPKVLLPEISRTLRPNGKAVIFCQEPYTHALIKESTPGLCFRYRGIWVKDRPGNVRVAKKAMVPLYEDFCVFGKVYDETHVNPLRQYAQSIADYINYNRRITSDAIASRGASYFLECDKNQKKWFLCTEAIYKKLIEVYKIDKMKGFIPYDQLKAMNKRYEPVFNLWQGGKTKTNVLAYPKDNPSLHPTQKPLALIEDLVQTFSNPGAVVLDPFMGSGTTAAACVRTGRNYIGFELDEKYHAIALERVAAETEAAAAAEPVTAPPEEEDDLAWRL
jgi:site-specific DNA-methyltransferase (adenine-specific)